MKVEKIQEGLFLIDLEVKYAGTVKPNLYVLTKGKSSILIDAGYPSRSFFEPMKDVFRDLGRPSHILLTHCHLDHSGMAGLLQDEFGCKVWIHKDGIPGLMEGVSLDISSEEILKKNWKRIGLKGNIRAWALEKIRGFNRAAKVPKDISNLKGGETLRLSGFDIKVIHTPGHSEGSCVFFLENEGLLFTGDTLLSPGLTTSMPSYQVAGRCGVLKSYMNSVESLKNIPARLVLPGHGEPFENLKDKAEEVISYRKALMEKVLKLLGKHPMTAYQISEAVSGEDDPLVRFITLGWVIEILKELNDIGIARRERENEAFVWAA